MKASTAKHQGLTDADLIPDRALLEGDLDAFRHEAIAGRLAELAVHGDTPLDIALFGPWGSGKSSVYELLRRELEKMNDGVALVRYDAWKFGGTSLQRNFISHVANELGFKDSKENRRFHTGLYESRRRALLDFDDREDGLRPAVGIFIGVFTTFLLAFAGLAGVSSVLTDENFVGQIGQSVPRFIAPSGLVAVIVALAKILLDGAKVDVEHAQPAADEEFARTFEALVEKARRSKGKKRLVVFIDELDRCSPEDVVETLTAIKTFLGQTGCVFIVAADRSVIERALESLEQATPVDVENPYYSSASAFFDKIFQHRTALPPLRTQRLTRFARDLVADRGGLWEDLRKRDDGRYLDDVIYALVPSHVRSPRRVKALLNDFALNVRIADAREIQWTDRAAEIAKLTVLHTEFPVLAADLPTEPRLPSLLLSPPTDPSPRVKRLLERHGRKRLGTHEEEDDADAETTTDAGSETPDPILAEASEAEVSQLGETETRLLIRYLERTADIPDPGRDLLYLEPAGAAVGIDDAALGEFVETEAPDSPTRVVAEIRDKTPDTQRGVAQMLAQMAEQEFGRERANVMTALLGVVANLGEEVGPIAGALTPAVRSYQQDRRLSEQHLVGALALGLAVPPTGDTALIRTLFDDDRLLDEPGRVEGIAQMLNRLPEDRRSTVWAAVARHLGEGTPQVLTSPLTVLPVDDATALFEADPVQEAVTALLDGSDRSDELVEALYAAIDSREEATKLQEALQWTLLGQATAYAEVRARAEDVMTAISPSKVADSHALLGIRRGPPDDWDFWPPFLSTAEYSWDVQGGRAVTVLTQALDGFRALSSERQTALAPLAASVGKFLSMAEESELERLLVQVRQALAAEAWWVGDDNWNGQARLHTAIWALRGSTQQNEHEIPHALLEDLQRAPLEYPGVTEQVLRGLREMGSRLGDEAVALGKALPAHAVLPAELMLDTTLTRLVLLGAASEDGQLPHGVLDIAEITTAAQAASPLGYEVIDRWIRTNPPPADVAQVIEVFGSSAPTRVVRAVEGWASGRTNDERTALTRRLLDKERDMSRWVAATTASEIDESELAEHIFDEVKRAPRAERRQELIDALVAIAPRAPSAQRKVADTIIYLLSSGKEVDFKVAQRAGGALGTQHRSAERLRKAFKAAFDEHGHQVSAKYVEGFARAGVSLPKKSLTDAAAKAFKSFFGG